MKGVKKKKTVLFKETSINSYGHKALTETDQLWESNLGFWKINPKCWPHYCFYTSSCLKTINDVLCLVNRVTKLQPGTPGPALGLLGAWLSVLSFLRLMMQPRDTASSISLPPLLASGGTTTSRCFSHPTNTQLDSDLNFMHGAMQWTRTLNTHPATVTMSQDPILLYKQSKHTKISWRCFFG